MLFFPCSDARKIFTILNCVYAFAWGCILTQNNNFSDLLNERSNAQKKNKQFSTIETFEMSYAEFGDE